LSEYLANDYSYFIHTSKYARWRDDLGRRETWEETVARYIDFVTDSVRERYGADLSEYRLSDAILSTKAMPSMRGLMTAGPALKRDSTCIYNCSYLPVDSLRSFDETMYILMCGTGVGYSVENKYVSQLPTLPASLEDTDHVIVVDDSKAGWAAAYRQLLHMLWEGVIPTWDMSQVRPAGARLKTFGGRASGPEPLDALFHFTVDIVRNAVGRKLRPIEAHDLMCKVADIVVVGGVRRSAMICLSDLNDSEMAAAKAGNWWETHPHRRLANISAVYESKPSVDVFMEEWKALYDSKSGERGIFNREAARKVAGSTGRRDSSPEFGTNPCSEIILRPFGFCNLTEVVVRPEDRLADLLKKVEDATVLGTIQSTFTDFSYLRPIWKENAEDERLLGVSLTGQLGHPVLQTNSFQAKAWLLALKKHAIRVNDKIAGMLGINPAAAITCVKPSGTVSQLVNCSSGMHTWHAEFYARTVRADNKDPLTIFMKDAGVPWEPDLMDPKNTTVFTFPVAAPEGAVTRNDLSAVEHLDIWLQYQNYWTEHKPSVTISVREDEWLDVQAWVYRNFDDISGISFLPHSDHTYKQAPYQELTEEEYNDLCAQMPERIDWSLLSLYETEDATTGSQELACVAGQCDLVDITK